MAIAAIFDRLGDFINPIAVKEMRQAVKGRILTWMLILFLLAQLLIMGGGILISEFNHGDFVIGPGLLAVLLIALLIVCLLFLPAIFGLRLSGERSGRRIDLLFITDMSPYSIIWGKTLAAIALTLLLFSTSLPFVTLTYLLRGIDIPSVFIMMGLNFIVVILTIQAALLLACFPGGIISRGIRFLLGLGGAIFVLSTMSSVSFALLQSGIGSLLGTWDFWGPALTIVGFILLGMGFLYVASAVMISPASSNRALVIRLYLFLIWLCCTLCALLWYLKVHDNDIIEMWVVLMSIFFSGVLVASLAERYTYGPRLRCKIPRRRVWRIPLFFFYSGAAGGMAFSLLMILLTLGVFYTACALSPRIDVNLPGKMSLKTTAICLYLICYGLSGLCLRRWFFSEQSSNLIAVMLAFVFLAFGSLLPFLIAWFFVYHDLDKVPEACYLGNPLIIFFEERLLETALSVTTIWALVALSLNVPWLMKQIRGFKPMPAVPVEPADAEPLVKPVVVEEEVSSHE